MNVVRDDGSSLNVGENAGRKCQNDRPAGCCSTNVIDILFEYVVRVIGQLKCLIGFGPQLTIKLVIEAPSSSNCDTNDQRSKSADRLGCRTGRKRPGPERQALECPEPGPRRPSSSKPKKCACSKRSCSGDRWKCDGDGRRKKTDFGRAVSSDRNDGGCDSFQQDKIVVNRICDKLSSIITKMCSMLETLADATPVACVPGSACQHGQSSDVSRAKCVETAAAESPCEDVPSGADDYPCEDLPSEPADCPCEDLPSDNEPAPSKPAHNKPADNKPADKVHHAEVSRKREPVVDPKPPRSERAVKLPATKPAANVPREHKRTISDKSVSDKWKDGECSRKIKQNNSRSRAENKKEITN